jgi:hypothetical protein
LAYLQDRPRRPPYIFSCSLRSRKCRTDRGRQIIMTKRQRRVCTTMLAAEHYPCNYGAVPNHDLMEVHRSKISLHHARTDYNYPTIRLPHTFSKLAGLQTCIYQTVHDGALAFLVVVSSSNKSEEENQKKSENLATDSRYSYLHGGDQEFESPRAHFRFRFGGWNRVG